MCLPLSVFLSISRSLLTPKGYRLLDRVRPSACLSAFLSLSLSLALSLLNPTGSSSPSLLSSLELSDTKVYEPYIRARLGTAAHFCEVVVLKYRVPSACPCRSRLSKEQTLQTTRSAETPPPCAGPASNRFF